MAETVYRDTFFEYHERGASESAREVVPLVLEYLRPASVVDVGCGLGNWLAEFKAAGIDDILGLDGSYVDRSKLLIPADRFVPYDLGGPIDLRRHFELAVCLEVAEHLREDRACGFVQSLTRLAPVVLFSAAIPFQGGDGHLNERWPSYWRDLFLAFDYLLVDVLRKPLWDNPRVMQWYRQNMFFYVDRRRLDDYPRLAEAVRNPSEALPLSIVHADHYTPLLEFMTRRVAELHRAVVRLGVRLREINLVAFVDWTQPPERIAALVTELFQALAVHPQRQRMTIVFPIAGPHEAPASQLLNRLFGQIVSRPGVAGQERAEVVTLGRNYTRDDWEVLLTCLQGRLQLAQEDTAMVNSTGAQPLKAIPLESVKTGKAIG